jgi:pyruvate/2-oxoglutarate dehydrogenase complex dihydrolipoamide dehydrogenase (E3) component
MTSRSPTHITTDICVIGAGSGGLSVAAGAVQMGARVVLVEAEEMGGDCLNFGCVPSKALIAAAKHAHSMMTGTAFGVKPATPQVDFAAVKDHVARTIATIAPVDSQERFEGLGVHVIRAFGSFLSPTELQAGSHIIRARRFVIATGSRPFIPPMPGVDTVPYLTNETIFALREKPTHLIIAGGGPIGMEMAQAHRRLGCDVTVIEGAKALGKDDPELAAVVLENLRAEGVAILEQATVGALSGSAGAVQVTLNDGQTITGSHLLLAVGRKVALDGLNLAAAGVTHTPKGVTIGPNLRSTNRRIYAVGDAAGGLQFTHVAGYHAGVIIRSAMFGLPSRAKTTHIPWVTYTDPELAQIGLTEAQAVSAHGAAVTVVRSEFQHNDRAVTMANTKGLIKVMVLKGRPIGVSIVGPQAGELISLWALALSANLKMSAIAGMVAPYPTLGEISKRAAGAYFSPKLFDNPAVKRIVGLVQRFLP